MAARQFEVISNMNVSAWSTAVTEDAPYIPIGLAVTLFNAASSGPTLLQNPARNRRLNPKGAGSGLPPLLQLRAVPAQLTAISKGSGGARSGPHCHRRHRLSSRTRRHCPMTKSRWKRKGLIRSFPLGLKIVQRSGGGRQRRVVAVRVPRAVVAVDEREDVPASAIVQIQRTGGACCSC